MGVGLQLMAAKASQMFVWLAALVLASVIPTGSHVSTQTHALWPPSTAIACCKYCHKGKACGNTCIARDKTCQRPPGCACDE
jgi:hypothetical protein